MLALLLLIVAVGIGYVVYNSELNKESKYRFKLGLDLNGGMHLVYKADVSEIKSDSVADALSSLRDVIEKRINVFGVTEPIIQIEQGGMVAGNDEKRLIVELPGMTDVEKAISFIGKTPLLEFKLRDEAIEKELNDVQAATSTDATIRATKLAELYPKLYIASGLTGKYVDRADLQFDSTTREPRVGLTFSSEGADLFAKITKENVGKVLAIYLDNTMISEPVIKQEITGGKAEISGNFKLTEAKELVRNLNFGALPVPIELIATQTIGASLGAEALHASVKAGIWAFLIIALFLMVWYRLPGFWASVSLAVYVVLNLAIFKLFGVTLTAAGIAAFILSLGMAVDANILIFERMKEELARGKTLEDAIKEGFARAWLSIRDSNLSSIITAVILFTFASTPIIKGFALVFFLGVVISMFTAVTVSRTLLVSTRLGSGSVARFLYSCGLHTGAEKPIKN